MGVLGREGRGEMEVRRKEGGVGGGPGCVWCITTITSIRCITCIMCGMQGWTVSRMQWERDGASIAIPPRRAHIPHRRERCWGDGVEEGFKEGG